MTDKPPPDISSIDLPLAPLVCAAAVLLVLSALFSVSESALLAMNKLRLRIKCRAGDRRALRVAGLLKEKDVLINSLLAANCLVNISLSSLVAKAAMQVWGNAGAGAAALMAAITLLIFGEITPKTLAARHADGIAYALSAFAALTVAVFRPAASSFTFLAHLVLRMFRLSPQSKSRSYTEDDIKTVIREGMSSGALERTESYMAQGVFRFTDLEAKDIMVPRKDIIAIEQEASRADIIALSRKTGHSRFPVYKDTIDNITGTLYVKDLLKTNLPTAPQECPAQQCSDTAQKSIAVQEYAQPHGSLTAKDVMRPPLFILGGKKMSSIQSMLQKNRQSMAIVVDEYSGTDGILTASDITERIFNTPSAPASSPSSSSSFTVPGTTLLSELRERLHIPINSDMSETLGGWLSERLGDLPKAGDAVNFLGYRFSVTEVSYHSVQSVRITDTNGKAGDK